MGVGSDIWGEIPNNPVFSWMQWQLIKVDEMGGNGWRRFASAVCFLTLAEHHIVATVAAAADWVQKISSSSANMRKFEKEIWILSCGKYWYVKRRNIENHLTISSPHFLVKLWIMKNALRSWVSLVPGRSPSPCCCGFLWWSTASWRSPGNLHDYHLRAHPHFQLLHNPCTNCLPVQHPWLWGEDRLHLQRLQPPAALPQPCQPQRIGPSWPSLLLRLLQARQLRQWILPAGDFMGFISFQRQKLLPIRLWQVR